MAKNNNLTNKRKLDRKNDILKSALKVFCDKGYDGATINDIVKKARCSHGLFYHYYSNKKDLFNAVLEMRGKSIMDFLDAVYSEDSNYIDKLYKLTEYTFSNMKKDEIFAYRFYFFLSTIFSKVESGEIPKCKDSDKVSPRLRMIAFFEEGMNRGEFKKDYPADECAKLYNCIIKGATLNFILCPKEFKSSFKFPTIEHIIDIFKKEVN